MILKIFPLKQINLVINFYELNSRRGSISPEFVSTSFSCVIHYLPRKLRPQQTDNTGQQSFYVFLYLSASQENYPIFTSYLLLIITLSIRAQILDFSYAKHWCFLAHAMLPKIEGNICSWRECNATFIICLRELVI